MSSWQKVEKRRDRRERKRTTGSQQRQQRSQVDPKQAFVDHILKEYKNKPADWKNAVNDVVNEMWTQQQLSQKNPNHVKQVLQRVTKSQAEALVYSYNKEQSPPQPESKDPSEAEAEDLDQEVAEQARAHVVDQTVQEAPTPEESVEEEEEGGDGGDQEVAQPAQLSQGAPEDEPEEEEEVDEEEEDVDEEEEEEENESEEEPEKPALTLAQRLAEEAKSFDILTDQGVQQINQWTEQISQEGEAGETYRTEFYKSNVLKSIVQALLTEKPNEEIPGTEEVIALFHAILQGNDDYHRWLYNQIRKLADYISKTSKRTHPEWMQFLQNQAFIIVDAQKDPKDGAAGRRRRGQSGDRADDALDFVLPTVGLFGANAQEEALKVLGVAADTTCKDMHSSLSALHEKDTHLLSMTPNSNSQFKERYTQVTGHLEQHISKANAHILAQQRNLEKINEQFRENERRSKDQVQPVQEQLRSVQHQSEQTKQSVLELEARLKSERQKLQELTMHEQNLKSQIQKIKAQHHPPRADLTSQRNNCQFKLHSVHREQNCYTHLRHIAMESHKHLVSWSQCNITRESDTRRLCLKKYYDTTEKYVNNILQMLQFLLSRIRWMEKKLRQQEADNNQRKAFFGGKGPSELEAECMEQDRQQIEFDRKVVDKLQVEIDKALNTACTAAYNSLFDSQLTTLFIHYFGELWTKVSTVAAQLKVNLNFVKLKAVQQQHNPAPQRGPPAGQPQQAQAQTNGHSGQGGASAPHQQQRHHPSQMNGQHLMQASSHAQHPMMHHQDPSAQNQHGRAVHPSQKSGLSNNGGGVGGPTGRAANAPLEIVNDTPGGPYQTSGHPKQNEAMRRPTKPPAPHVNGQGRRIPPNAASGNAGAQEPPQNGQSFHHPQPQGRGPRARRPPQNRQGQRHWGNTGGGNRRV